MKPIVLDKLFSIYAPTKNPNGSLAENVLIGTVWGKLMTIRSDEQAAAGGTSSSIAYKIRTRYKSILKPSWYLTYKGRTFVITAPPININEQDRYLDIPVKEGISG